MEFKFFADKGGELDFSNQKYSLQESNSKMSDQMFAKFTFSFQIPQDDNFVKQFGDYTSHETTNLDTVIPGFCLHENKLQKAKLNISNGEGEMLSVQIDFGLEELPNFDKKLSELPLENFKVDDIHTYARSICDKVYPQTNYNFPRIYSKKLAETEGIWDAFDGYYNDLKQDGTEMRRNTVDGSGNIFNVNIIHPCPHVLYLLKAGFADAGYNLAGDILTDADLLQRWVFSGTNYFSTLVQKKLALVINAFDYKSVSSNFGIKRASYWDVLNVPLADTYKFQGFFAIGKSYGSNGFIKIFLNNVLIYQYFSNTPGLEVVNIDFSVNIAAGSTLRVEAESFFADTLANELLQLELIGQVLEYTTEGEETDVVNNLNEVNLQRAVPELTFGEFFNIIKNWFNYELSLSDNIITMNKIDDSNPTEISDFQFSEILKPKKVFLQKKSFLLKFSDLDEGKKKDSMYFDKDGPKINGAKKNETTVIEINGYAMPVFLPKVGGYTTANIQRETDSCVALVGYEGMTGNNNNAVNPPGCDFPELFVRHKPFLLQRINGNEFGWTFLANAELFSRYKINEQIFCYNNVHNIKSWLKNKVGENTYEVEITTETIT